MLPRNSFRKLELTGNQLYQGCSAKQYKPGAGHAPGEVSKTRGRQNFFGSSSAACGAAATDEVDGVGEGAGVCETAGALEDAVAVLILGSPFVSGFWMSMPPLK